MSFRTTLTAQTPPEPSCSASSPIPCGSAREVLRVPAVAEAALASFTEGELLLSFAVLRVVC